MKQTEIESLQNAVDEIGLTIHEKFQDDKRKSVKKYFAQRGNETVSPVLDYEQLNHFLLGWIKCLKITPPATPVNEGQQPVPDANLFSDEIRDKSLKWWVNLGHEQAWTLREKYFPHRSLLTASERLKIYLAEHEGQQQPAPIDELEALKSANKELREALKRIADCWGLQLDKSDAAGFTKIAKEALNNTNQ